MKRYRVVYKKYSEIAKGFALVEEDIEAADFNIIDGNLVFYNDNGDAMRAMPMTAWAGVEPAPINSSTMIVGGR